MNLLWIAGITVFIVLEKLLSRGPVVQRLVGSGSTGFRILTDLSGGPERWTFGRSDTALATGDHHMGALRMSASTDDGIVNPDCRFHGIDNLYAAGSAVFPTSGAARLH